MQSSTILNSSIHGSIPPSKNLDEVLEATEMQDNAAELQWDIKTMFIGEEEPKNYGEELSCVIRISSSSPSPKGGRLKPTWAQGTEHQAHNGLRITIKRVEFTLKLERLGMSLRCKFCTSTFC